MALIKCSPGQQWPGFSFALHLLRVQGFYFTLLQYSYIQSFTAVFISFMQLYHPHGKTAHRALHVLFLLFAVFCRCCCMAVYPAMPHYLRHAGAYHSAPPGRCATLHSRPIIIRYIRAQHTADRANPAGSASPPVQGQPGGVSMLPMPCISLAPG
nr:MAG TPA: hypothetical protein [Caudoviricetes sp.]